MGLAAITLRIAHAGGKWVLQGLENSRPTGRAWFQIPHKPGQPCPTKGLYPGGAEQMTPNAALVGRIHPFIHLFRLGPWPIQHGFSVGLHTGHRDHKD